MLRIDIHLPDVTRNRIEVINICNQFCPNVITNVLWLAWVKDGVAQPN